MAIEEIRFQAELEFIDDFRIGRPGGLKRRRRGIPAPRFEAARVFEIGHDIIGGFPPHRDIAREILEIGRVGAVDSQRTVAADAAAVIEAHAHGSEEHTSELQSLMRISYAVFCLKKKK